MASSDNFFSGQKPAAVLKHAVFSTYASVFFAMLGSRHSGPMWLIDGYAGPGRYEADGTGKLVNGSPIVALELASKQREFSPPRDVRCAFIEAKKAHFDALSNNVAPFREAGLHVEMFHGSAADHLGTVWEYVDGNPVLTFIDPFGVSAVSNEQMTDVLLDKDRKTPSEVLVNINVEAISRHGGCLQWSSDREPELKSSVKHEDGIELSDAFFGGEWWRRKFLEARNRADGDANKAAMEVVNEYRDIVRTETGASSLVVPIRRSPTGPMLFQFTLFYRHSAAAYKFADAAATGTAKWREVFRQKDLGEVLAREEEQPSLFGVDEIIQYSDRDATTRETQLKADAVAHIEANVRRMIEPLLPGQGLKVGENIEALLGDYLSLAGQPALIAAWKNLDADGVVRARDKSQTQNLWKASIFKQ
ncbi:MAG: three-Cys-motif partner protein TcmP [Nocardioides sp.]